MKLIFKLQWLNIKIAETPNGDQSGTVTQVYNNTTGAGEQVYAVVENPNEKADKV